MKKTMMSLHPYETPEAEELTVFFSENILSGTSRGANAPDVLEEEDYSDIWNN